MIAWRSLLFVPATSPQRWLKAHLRGADALIVDLEDSIEPDAKAAARTQAASAVQHIAVNNAAVTARINNHPEHLALDVEAVGVAGLSAVLLPKTEQASDVQQLSALLDAQESRAGLAHGTIGVIAVIESPLALERVQAIADSPRVIGVALGSEDFALAVGRKPGPLSLDLAAQTIAYAASARGLMGIGMPGGVADFSDLEAFASGARRAHAMGLTGALCIHPAQVAVLNEAFGFSDADVQEAQAIIAAWENRTTGVVSHAGKMIDHPVVERARRLLTAAGRAGLIPVT